MQKIFMLVAVMLFGVLSAGAQTASLRGKVVQKTNQESLPGAHVYFDGSTIGTATNNQGEFQLNNLTPGNHELIISFSGFSRVKQNIDLKEGVNTFNVQLEESDMHLGEIIITGTGTAHHLKTAPVPTELFNSKIVKSVGAADFNELMANLSPSFDFSPSGMGPMMTINGLGNDFILVLVDGKRMYGDVGGNNDLNRINPDNIERIEVLKGAASLLYGSDAIAGVVNVITKKGKQKINVSNTTRYRNHSTLQQSNSIDLNLGRFSWNATVNHKSSDGWQLSPYELDDEELVETDAMAQNKYRDCSFNHVLTFRATDKFELYAGNSYYEKDLFYPETFKKYGFYYTDMAYEAGAKYLLSNKETVSVDYNFDRFRYYNKYNQDYKDFVVGQEVINTDQQMGNYRLKYVNAISKNNKLTVGADYLDERLVSQDRLIDGEAAANTMALYAQDEHTFFNAVDLVAGLRYVKHKEFGSAFTPKVSMLWKLNDFNIRGTYGYGFKAPTLKELYYNYEKRGTVYMGNKDLDPQKSQFSSVGFEYNNDFISTSITGYINNVNDLITYGAYDLLPGDEENGIKKRRKHYNVEDSRSQGIDLLVNAKIGYGFTLGGGYSFVDAKDLTADIRLEGVAQNYGNVRVNYDHSWGAYKLNVNVIGRIQDEKFYDDGNAKAYQIWKLTTNHRFTNLGPVILEGELGVDNIFDYVDDSPYGSHYGTINPGRTIFVGLKANFSK